MGNLPIQEQWIFDWFASDTNSYIVFSVTIAATIIHPILFILHLYRKFIKSSDSGSKQDSTRNPNGNNNIEYSTNNKSQTYNRSHLSNERSTTFTHSKMSVNRNKSNNNALAKHDQRILYILKRIVDITTLLAIFFGWLATIFTFINYLEIISNPNTCQPMTILQNICWIFTKLCIYHVLIIRLQIAFWGSTHEYNRYLMFISYCFVTIISLICIIGSFIDVQSVHFPTGWCLFIIPTWIILLPCALDLICSIFALYLFMRPLKTMLNKIDLDNINSKNKRIIHKNKLALNVAQLITKLILLTSIAVISNLFGGIFFAITDIALGSFIDTLINPICLILMEVKHKDVYKKCCKYCHIGLHKIVHLKNKSIKSRPFGALLIIRQHTESTDDNHDPKHLKLPLPSTRIRGNTSSSMGQHHAEFLSR